MNPLLSVRNLGIEIHRGQMQKQQVVQDITFEVYEKEIFGVVGESGSGKTLTALSLLALLPPAAKITSGSIQFKNKDVLPYQEKVIRELRGKEISYIFQEPGRSFDPLHTIGSTMSETFRRIYPMEKQDLLTQKSIKILQDLHISHAERRLKNYPHQFSGGMLQRVMIALALIQNPQLIIADEPTTSLDVTIQAEVIRLLIELQKKRRFSMIFISHNIALIASIAHRIAVMYRGHIVECDLKDKIISSPQHEYSKLLIKNANELECY